MRHKKSNKVDKHICTLCLYKKSKETKGIVFILSDSSGSGKTMVAEKIALYLDLGLYEIDLSQVVRKYIEETENSLRIIFKTAEENNEILFFDEFDDLFDEKKEDIDSKERLLKVFQKMIDEFLGIVIISKNIDSNLKFIQLIVHKPIFIYLDKIQQKNDKIVATLISNELI